MSSSPSSTSSPWRRLAGFATASLLLTVAGLEAVNGQAVPAPAANSTATPAPAAATPAPAAATPAATPAADPNANANFGRGNRGNRGNRRGAFAAPTDTGAAAAPFTPAGAAVPAPTAAATPNVPAPTPFGTPGPTPFPIGPAGAAQPGGITSTAVSAATGQPTATNVIGAPAGNAGAANFGGRGAGRGGQFGGPGGQFAAQQAGTLAQGAVPNPDDLLDTNFVNASAQDIISFLQRNTDKVILAAQDLPSLRINFSSRTGDPNAYSLMTRAQVVSASLALLAMNGITIVPESDKVWRVYNTPTAAINSRLPEILSTDAIRTMPSSEVVYGEFIKLNYITVDEAVPRITNFMSTTSSSAIIPFAKEGTIFLADTLTNLKRIEEILKRIDEPVVTQKEIIFKPLKNARATEVLTSLQSLATGALSEWLGSAPAGNGGAAAASPTYLAADARSNSLIVVTNKANRALVDQLINTFDVDVDPSTRSEVFVMKQADAPTLGPILQNLINSVRTAAAGANAAGGGAAAGRGAGAGGRGAGAAVPAGVPGIAAAAADASQQQFSQFLTVTTDTRTNSIIVYGTPSDLQQVGRLIEDLDFQLPQVQIQVVITEVTLTKNQVSGLSTFGLNYGFTPADGTTTPLTIGGNRTASTQTSTLPGSAAGPAFSLAGSLTSWDLNAVFNVARDNNKVRVLSSPIISTTHNTAASIQVGQSVPLITSTTAQVQTSLTNNNVTSTVNYTNVTLLLQVTPRIGKDNSVSMLVSQTVNDILGYTQINGVQQPIIGTRSLNGTVTLPDGGVMVLGGLRSRKETKSHGVVFLLGEIPILGQLFQPDTETSEERELIVFIKPTVMRNIDKEAVLVEQSKRDSEAAKMSVRYLRDNSLDDIVPEPANPPNTTQQNSISTGFRR